MSVDFFAVGVNAYKNIAKMEKNFSKAEKIFQSETHNPSFSDLIKKNIQSAIYAGNQAENMAIKSSMGKADILDVVQAIGKAEETLKTIVTIRDKAITAYQNIIQMPI